MNQKQSVENVLDNHLQKISFRTSTMYDLIAAISCSGCHVMVKKKSYTD